MTNKQIKQLLTPLKNEIAHEIGIDNYETINKAELPSKVNGLIGGLMVKKMIEEYEKNH